MSRHSIAVLASATVAAAAFAGSAAADPTATLSGGYSQIKASNLGALKFDDWGVAGAAQVTIAPQWRLQGDAAYDDLKGGGVSGHTTNVSGTALWSGQMGRVGATLGYNEFGVSGHTATFTTYGAFGELYAGDYVTLGVKVGEVSGSGTNTTYGGAEIVGYAGPNAAISATVDGLRDGGISFTSYGVRGEVLPVAATPISLYGGYTYQAIGPIHFDIYSVGLKIYFGRPAGASLRDRQRNGVDVWGATRPNLKLLF